MVLSHLRYQKILKDSDAQRTNTKSALRQNRQSLDTPSGDNNDARGAHLSTSDPLPSRRRQLHPRAAPGPRGSGNPNGAKRRGRKPGQKNFEKSATSLPRRSRRGGVPPWSRPTMPLRRSPLQSLVLIVPWSQRRNQPPRRYERSSRRRC